MGIWLDKDEKYTLKYDKLNKEWYLYYKNKKEKSKHYKWSEVRASIAYRAWCFKNASMSHKYDPYLLYPEFNIEYILNKIKLDLSKRWNKDISYINSMHSYDLGIAMIDEYITLPQSPNAWFKFNYCAIFDYFKNKMQKIKQNNLFHFADYLLSNLQYFTYCL